MFTRSMTKHIQSFTEQTVGHCVVYQIEHTDSICLTTHDLDDLWDNIYYYMKIEQHSI